MIFEMPERCGSTGRAVDKDEDDLSVQVVFEDGSDGWFAIASLCRPGASARTAGDSEQVRRAVSNMPLMFVKFLFSYVFLVHQTNI